MSTMRLSIEIPPIVKRHLYYHLIVNIDDGSVERTVLPNHGFEPDHLSNLTSANPCILHYVRTLEIKFVVGELQDDESVEQQLHRFAATLVKFPTLECIMLKDTDRHKWHWPHAFRSALKDRLHLSTHKKVHFDDSWDLLLPLLDNCENIINLSLAGMTQYQGLYQPLHLPSAQVTDLDRSDHSLRICSHGLGQTSHQGAPVIEVCGNERGSRVATLLTLDINLVGFYGKDIVRDSNRLRELSPFPPNLRRLIIRTSIVLEKDEGQEPGWYLSSLPAAAEVITLLVPPPRHLILDITIDLINGFSSLANIDFSPLAVLGAVSVPDVDLYVHTGDLPSALTRAQLLCSLEDYEDVMRSIKEGVVVIHSEKTAPDYV